ncbi:MAG: SsrA-binding protein SmpB [Thermodesulfobacteriota bacterium]|nr:SsrA-binding protein SmpB [Thermodesulfobacteriota bacterium]
MGTIKLIAQNKKALFDFFLEENIEAGIVLLGTEVKSCRLGKVNLKEGYAKIKNSEVFLTDVHISPYSHGNQFNHNPTRERKLLLHKRQIKRLTGKVNEKGMTLIPTKMYFKDGKVKIEIALAKGKKLIDKREIIKQKTIEREIQRDIKQ